MRFRIQRNKLIIILVLIWTAGLSASLLWDRHTHKQETIDMVTIEARASLVKDLQMRRWGTAHGGVYVRPDERTPPNPYLADQPERDVVTTTGTKLTLMNPAYILRQIMDEYSDENVRTRITSLKPINPRNAPDAWERKALEDFETGADEAVEVSTINGTPYLRLMHPMIIEEGCLKCHASQGYKVGQIRGGISVAVSLAPALAIEKEQASAHLWLHLLLWVAGITGLMHLGYVLKKNEEADRASRQSEEKYKTLFNSNQIGVAVVNARGGLLEVNSAFCEMLGYTESEALSMTFSDFSHPGAELDENQALFKELVEGKRASFSMEKKYVHKDGRVIWGNLSVFGIFDRRGKFTYGYGIISDITKRKEYEEQMEKSLAEKSTLLKEVHHRVKNNLAIVLSLLDLQSEHCRGAELKESLGDTRSRIKAMALVHEHLYRNKNLADIKVADYLRGMLASLAGTFNVDRDRIRLDSEASDITLQMDLLIPCGLIINELVTNSLKHAFNASGRGSVSVTLSREGETGYRLIVSDDGSGLPENIETSSTLGLQLVGLLTAQLDGTMEVARQGGTSYTIRFGDVRKH